MATLDADDLTAIAGLIASTGVTLADGVAHGGPPGSSTATFAMQSETVKNSTVGDFNGGAAVFHKGYSYGAGQWNEGGADLGLGDGPGVGLLNKAGLENGSGFGNHGVLCTGTGLSGGDPDNGGAGLALGAGPCFPALWLSMPHGGANGAEAVRISSTEDHGIVVTAGTGKSSLKLTPGVGGYGLEGTASPDFLNEIDVAAPSGVATTFPGMLVQTWRRFFKKATKTATQIKTYADDGSTVVTTQAISSSGGTDTQGAAT